MSHTKTRGEIMDYKKYQNAAYNLHVMKTDKFKTITVKINFKRKLKKEEIIERNLLGDILLESSEKYPTSKDIAIETEELYDLRLGHYIRISGNYSIMSFYTCFLNEAYTEAGMNEASIDFLLEFLFHPHIIQKAFTKEAFKLVKNSLKEALERNKENYRRYSSQRLYEEMGPEELYSLRAEGYLEDLEQTDEKKLYAYYEQVLKSDIVDIYVIGNIDGDKIKTMFQEKFKINTLKKPSESHYIEHKKMRRRARSVVETNDSKQSFLHLGGKGNR